MAIPKQRCLSPSRGAQVDEHLKTLNNKVITMQMVSDWVELRTDCESSTPEERETFAIETITRLANNEYSISELQDDLPREAQCVTCNMWIHEGDVILATEDGKLTTDIGDPYCDTCLPMETVE